MRGHRLTQDLLARIDRWAARESIDCLYFLADSDDPATAPLAEASGFRLVDVRITMERRGGAGGAPGHPATEIPRRSAGFIDASEVAAGSRPGPPPAAAAQRATAAALVRPALPADLPGLRRIAAASHHDSRFYHDPHFDRGRCGELYSTWIDKSCGDPAGIVLVAQIAAGLPAGYITAAVTPGGAGRIGLFAVSAAAQGRGIGGQLVAAALAWFAGRGAEPVTVVTQGRNLRAQRIYQEFGLRTRSVELWYHRWRETGAAAGPGGR